MPRTIATNTRVDLDGLLDFVRPCHHMTVITRRADGSPQASPVSGGVDAVGRIVVSTYPERAKTHNARRDPRCSVLVLSDDFGGAVLTAAHGRRRRRGARPARRARTACRLLPRHRR